MIKMKKKGIAYSTLISILITIMVAIVIFGAFTNLFGMGKPALTYNTCLASVIARNNLKADIYVTKVDKFVPLACPTIDLGELTGSREEVKKEIADSSAKCWDMFLRGTTKNIFDVDQGEKQCHVCYSFSIPEQKTPFGKVDKGVDAPVDKKLFTNERAADRTADKITIDELLNFFYANNYNPKLLYGGAAYYYRGGKFDLPDKLHLKTENPIEIDPSDVLPVVNSFAHDYSAAIKMKTIEKIDEAGSKILAARGAQLFVVIAERFDSFEKKDAREIIESSRLNSEEGKYDAILVMVDLTRGKVRIQMGQDLDNYVAEQELTEIVNVNANKAKDINEFVQGLMETLTLELVGNQNAYAGMKIDPKSYFGLIWSNGNVGMIRKNIVPGNTYYIAYYSSTDKNSALQTIKGLYTQAKDFISGTPISINDPQVTDVDIRFTVYALTDSVLEFVSFDNLGLGHPAYSYNKNKPNILVIEDATKIGQFCSLGD